MMRRAMVTTVAVLGLAAGSSGACLGQQPATIHILLLNGNNGKPLTVGSNGKSGTPLSLTIFPVCGQVCFFPGSRHTWSVDSSGQTEVPNMEKLRGLDIMLTSTGLKFCQDTTPPKGALSNYPRFQVSDIVRTGLVAPNTCNTRLKIQPHPGQLVFFLRPPTMWETLTRPPQM